MKTCSKCNKTKSVDEFHWKSKAQGRREARCKACIADYYQANRNRMMEQSRQYHQANRDQLLEHKRKHYQANREQIREYYEANKERRLEYQREWRINNPLRKWAQGTHSGHKRCGYDVQLTIDQIHEWAKDTPCCPICGVLLKYSNGKMAPHSGTLDRMNNEHHIDDTNSWIICYRCNNAKSTKTLNDYMKQQIAA